MPRLFIGNFDFEHQLVRKQKTNSKLWHNLPKRLRRINAELSTVFLAIAEDGDSLLLPESIDPNFFEEAIVNGLPKIQPITFDQINSLSPATEVIPWGVNAEIVAFAKNHNFHIDCPEFEKIRIANSRVTAFDIAKQLQILLPGSSLVSERNGFAHAMKCALEYSSQWIMKAEFGMSGRERISGHSFELTASQKGWISNRLADHQRIIVEPFLENQEEVSWHWHITQNKSPEFLGVTELFNTPNGEYRGNRVPSNSANLMSKWTSSFEATQHACNLLKILGYFGPVSIDSMQYQSKNGNFAFHSLMDINARYTMGRIALEFQQRLSPDKTVEWIHIPHSENTDLEDSTELIYTTPKIVGGTPSSRRTFLRIES